MKYLRLFNSHSDYDAKSSSLPDTCVVCDGEHIHYIHKSNDEEEEDEEPTDTTTIVE